MRNATERRAELEARRDAYMHAEDGTESTAGDWALDNPDEAEELARLRAS